MADNMPTGADSNMSSNSLDFSGHIGPSTMSSSSLSDILDKMNTAVPIKQQVILEGNDDKYSFSIYGQQVTIVASDASNSSQQDTGSNKVKINPIVTFDWENKYYIGNLIAVHRNDIYLAYVLRVKAGGNVRVVNRKSAQRALIKGFAGRVVDIAFAHLDAVTLGMVDEMGNLHIYEIQDSPDGKIETTLVLQINRPENTVPTENHRIIWCPYIPEEDESNGTATTSTTESLVDDVGKLLVVTHNELAQMWNVETVNKEYGSGPLQESEVNVGLLTINNHTDAIVAACFSPDGTALATASLDGYVKFFQVYMQDRSPPRCLHQWQPHEEKPLSSLFFLDDHKHPNPDIQFWKFAITGADHNRELKIWSCETWICLQTVMFSAPLEMPLDHQMDPCVKVVLDLSANYLVLSDTKRMVLYVLQLFQDMEHGRAHISSVAEFLLTQPCLSLAIQDAGRRRFKKQVEPTELGDVTTGELSGDEEDEEASDQVEGPEIGVLVRLYSIHTRALQELQIRYKSESLTPQPPPASLSSMSQSQDGMVDALSDLSLETTGTMESGELPPGGPLLLTPEAFTTSSPRRIERGVNSDTRSSASSLSTSSFTQVTAMDDDMFRTPRGSEVIAQQSPGSSITLTPTSSRDFVGNSVNTPPSLPHVPAPQAEEQVPVSPASNRSGNVSHEQVTDSEYHTSPNTIATDNPATREDTFNGLKGAFPPPPKTIASMTPSREVKGLLPGRPDDLMRFSTPSPSTLANRVTRMEDQNGFPAPPNTGNALTRHSDGLSELNNVQRASFPSPPATAPAVLNNRELEESMQRSQDANDEAFSAASTGSSSSTSLEVSEILDSLRVSHTEPVVSARQQPDSLAEETPEKKSAEYDQKIWPKPPVVDETMNREAQRLAAEAIHKAATSQAAQPLEEGGERTSGEEEYGDDADDAQVMLHTKESVKQYGAGDAPEIQSFSEGASGDAVTERQRYSDIDPQILTTLQESMKQIEGLVKGQQSYLDQVRTELERQHQFGDSVGHMQAQLQQLQTTLSSMVASALTQHTQTQSQQLQDLLTEKESQERNQQEQLLNILSGSMQASVEATLHTAVREQMQKIVVPNVRHVLEPLQKNLHTEVAQKLTATDSLVKDNISKIIRSRQTIEAIGTAAGNAIQGPIHAAVRDVVVPGFDRACQNMMRQVGDTIEKGIGEYGQQLQGHAEEIRQFHDSQNQPVLNQMKGTLNRLNAWQDSQEAVSKNVQVLSDTVKSELAATRTHLGEQLAASVGQLEEQLLTKMKQVVEQEVSKAVREQHDTLSDSLLTAMRSRAQTPAPSPVDPQQQQQHISQLLRQGQLNTAFQIALSASDLNLVMFVCETVDPSQVFTQVPCPLKQPVLLSLIQQLSADLTSNTQLKHKYLEEAVMNLDPTIALTREHMPTVLGALVIKLQEYVQNNHQDRMARSMRMLLMACQSLLK